MIKVSKKLEIVQVALSSEDEFSFRDLLTSDGFEAHEIWVKGKWVTAKILQIHRNFLVGLVITTRSSNIPPKRNRRNKRTEALGLSNEEGLAYANVFLYSPSNNILFYEVNKFGCYLDHFIEFLYKSFEEDADYQNFSIELHPVLNRNEYNRMLTMNQHKSLEVVLANPQGIINAFENQNNALLRMLTTASSVGSEKFKWKYEVAAKSPRSLASRTLRQIIDQLMRIVASPVGENVKKIEVKGYEQDPDEEKITTIDLIADRFQASIVLEEPRENVDLLEEQRRNEIVREYRRSLEDLNEILGDE